MLEQDYIMRLIKEMVRTLLKLLFHIDLDNPAAELFKDTEQKNMLQNLLDFVDKGEINHAENQIYEMMSNETAASSMKSLKMALLFYAHLNEKSNEFLEEHDFSREEVKQGIQSIIDQYGLNSVSDTFLSDL